MDFLEIRRKAKERAAARAAAAAQAPVPPAPAAEAPRRALALDPLPLPPAEGAGPSPGAEALQGQVMEPALGRAPAWPPAMSWTRAAGEPAGPDPEEAPAAPAPEDERQAAETAAEAARIEAELEAKLREMPSAGDARFLTWRPSGGAVPALAPITPVGAPGGQGPEGDPRRGAGRDRRRSEQAARGDGAGPGEIAPGDPLEEFFYREDEQGPALGSLAATAEAPAPAAEVVERVEYLTFLLGAEEYGVEIDRVREVMRSPPITEVPRAPADVLGVITVRGEVVAVFDPRRRLGLPPGGSTEGGRVILVDDGAGPCGLLVDAVASVVRLPRGSIEARPQGIGGASADCLEGIGRDRDRLFTVLSVAALLKPTRRAEGVGS